MWVLYRIVIPDILLSVLREKEQRECTCVDAIGQNIVVMRDISYNPKIVWMISNTGCIKNHCCNSMMYNEEYSNKIK